MAEQKTQPTNASARAFLESVEPEGKRRDALALADLMTRVTGMEPAMWGPSIVGYGIYHYKYASGHSGSSFLTGFSPRKANLVVYIMPGFAEMQPLMRQLGKFKAGKSCLYVNRLANVDMGILEELIRCGFTWMTQKYETG